MFFQCNQQNKNIVMFLVSCARNNNYLSCHHACSSVDVRVAGMDSPDAEVYSPTAWYRQSSSPARYRSLISRIPVWW